MTAEPFQREGGIEAAGRTPRDYAVPAAVVLLAILALEWSHDVSVGDSLLYLAYELALVLLPGLLIYRALARRPGGFVRQVAFGWALGYVVEIISFELAGALGARGAYFLIPLILGGAAWAWRRRRMGGEALAEEGDPADPPSRWFPWALAVTTVLAVAYVAIPVFSSVPLPGSSTVVYNPDFPWSLSMSAEAKHHFPLEDPNVAGEPLAYHYFVNVHQAAASQVTGIDLASIAFRLHIPPLVVTLMLGVAAAGQAFVGRLWVGLLAGCLIIFVGEIQLDLRENLAAQLSFLGAFLNLLYSSPSFLFGLAIMFPLVVSIGERIADHPRTRAVDAGMGEWILISLLAFGAFNAKVSTVPLLLVGLAIFAGWAWWTHRRVPAAVWTAGAILVAVGAFYWATLYRGHSGGLGLDLTAGYEFFSNMPAISSARSAVEDLLPVFPLRDAFLFLVGLPIGILGLFGPQLVGLLWFVRRDAPPLRAGQVWLLALLGAGMLSLLLLREPGAGNQLYPLFSGVAVGCVLAAEGLRRAWHLRPERWSPVLPSVLAIAWIGLLVALIATPVAFDLFSGELAEPRRALLLYGGLIVALLLLALAAARLLSPSGRWAAAAAATAAIVLVGLIDAPGSTLIPTIKREAEERVEPAVGLTPELYEALLWIREETPTDAVLAVDAVGLNRFDYAAFSERRNFLGGWAYATESRDVGLDEVSRGSINPFADRVDLIESTFSGDAPAAEELYEAHGVRYLLVDRVNGPDSQVESLTSLGPIVFDNEDAAVIELAPP